MDVDNQLFQFFRIPLPTRLMITQEQKQIKAQKLNLREARQEQEKLEADQEKRNRRHHQRQCLRNLPQVITDTPCSGMSCNRQCLICSCKFNKQYF